MEKNFIEELKWRGMIHDTMPGAGLANAFKETVKLDFAFSFNCAFDDHVTADQ